MAITASDALNAKAREKVNQIEARFWSAATRGDRFADAVARRVGSWPFILVQSMILGIWITWNSLPSTPLHFDAPPFIGLNLLLSFQAAYTAPFIMMSQNRSSAKDRTYAETDFITNEVAGSEIEEMHDHLDELVEGARMRLAMMTDQGEMLKRLEQMEERQLRIEQLLQRMLEQRGA